MSIADLATLFELSVSYFTFTFPKHNILNHMHIYLECSKVGVICKYGCWKWVK